MLGYVNVTVFTFYSIQVKNVLKVPDMLSRSVTIANTLSLLEMNQAIDSSIDMKTILQHLIRNEEKKK